jgi:hypothetical protein
VLAVPFVRYPDACQDVTKIRLPVSPAPSRPRRCLMDVLAAGAGQAQPVADSGRPIEPRSDETRSALRVDT